MVLLARNTVKDFEHWKRIFDAQTDAGHAAGLKLLQMWRSDDDANNVFFIFDVEDRARAEAYMITPKSAAVGSEAGVIEGEYHFLNLVEVP